MEGKGRTGRILGDGVGVCNEWAMSGQLLGIVVKQTLSVSSLSLLGLRCPWNTQERCLVSKRKQVCSGGKYLDWS